MTEQELKAIKDGFEHLNNRISDIEAKLNKKGDVEVKTDEGIKFEDIPNELKEPDKSAEIKSWWDKKVFE